VGAPRGDGCFVHARNANLDADRNDDLSEDALVSPQYRGGSEYRDAVLCSPKAFHGLGYYRRSSFGIGPLVTATLCLELAACVFAWPLPLLISG